MFYNPLLFPKVDRQEALTNRSIDVVDVAPTVAGYLQHVDIPLLSIGLCQNNYGSQLIL